MDPIEALILDLLEFVGPDSRPYSEVLEAWRTSCPRLPVWEEATERGLIERHHRDGHALVSLTSLGHELLAGHGRASSTVEQ
jgi:hypothetical protein